MSKFEYNPSSFIVYNNDCKFIIYLFIYFISKYLVSQSDSPNSGVRYIIGTHSHTLFIVQDAHIRWAAHIDSVPIQIDVCTIQ